MFYSELTQAQVIINCPRTYILNFCDQIYVSGDTLYASGNVEQQEYCEFLG